MRRAKAANRRKQALWDEAWTAAVAKFGEPKRFRFDSPFERFLDEHPAKLDYDRIPGDKVSSWRATAMADGTLVFHGLCRPARVRVRAGDRGLNDGIGGWQKAVWTAKSKEFRRMRA